MTAAIITSKGRITIPANVRKALNIKSGDRVKFAETQMGRFEFFVATKSVRNLKGMFGEPARHVSIEEMNKMKATRAIPE